MNHLKFPNKPVGVLPKRILAAVGVR